MVALAFLVAAATLDRARHPTPAGLTPLTCNELQHLFAPLVIRSAADLGIGCPGRGGDADINTAPAPATTSDKPPSNHEHHDLRLEY